MNSIKECRTLNNGVQIPCLGFGTYKAAEGSTSKIIKTAVRCGYRYLDTASFYQTETYVGEAVKESKIPREEFFLVSKVWKDEMGYDNTLRAFLLFRMLLNSPGLNRISYRTYNPCLTGLLT